MPPDADDTTIGQPAPLAPVASDYTMLVRVQRHRDLIVSVLPPENGTFDEVVDDIVEGLERLGPKPSLEQLLGFPFWLYKRHKKRKAFRRVVRSIVSKLFDPTLEYGMDFADVVRTCNTAGGESFIVRDYELLYDLVVEKLQCGKIRDACLRLGISWYADYKIREVLTNFTAFRISGDRT